MAPVRDLLCRLAAGELVITTNYGPKGGGYRYAHRRGLVVSERHAACRWRHDLTPRGREAFAVLAAAWTTPDQEPAE